MLIIEITRNRPTAHPITRSGQAKVNNQVKFHFRAKLVEYDLKKKVKSEKRRKKIIVDKHILQMNVQFK